MPDSWVYASSSCFGFSHVGARHSALAFSVSSYASYRKKFTCRGGGDFIAGWMGFFFFSPLSFSPFHLSVSCVGGCWFTHISRHAYSWLPNIVLELMGLKNNHNHTKEDIFFVLDNLHFGFGFWETIGKALTSRPSLKSIWMKLLKILGTKK